MAPELLCGQPHDRMIDWWALGIVAFEFLSGGRPFDGDSFGSVNKKACKGISWSTFSSVLGITYNKDAKDFIDQLLLVDPTGRLTYQRGFSEIKKHPWFSDVRFSKLVEGKTTPPIRPGVAISSGGGMAGMMFDAGGGGIGGMPVNNGNGTGKDVGSGKPKAPEDEDEEDETDFRSRSKKSKKKK